MKKNKGINIVVGNPPYSGISQNNGEWITKLVNEYKYTEGVYFGEKKHWLNDDYVKFIRLGQEYVSQSGCGVLAFITNHAFLDNPTFRAMRWNLLRAFDEIFILYLHGDMVENLHAGIDDENVFDIKKGVAVSIFIKKDAKDINELAKVYNCDFVGCRTDKYVQLEQSTFEGLNWEIVQYMAPYYLFKKRDESNRENWESSCFAVQDLFSNSTSGIVSMGDAFAFGDTIQEMRSHVSKLLLDKVSPAE